MGSPRSVSVPGVVALVLAALFWAGNYVFGAIAVTTMDPFSLTFLRWAFAVVPLVVLAQVMERPDWRAILRRWPYLALRGALGLAAYSLLLYLALSHTNALAASLINAANPALIAVAARVLLGDELGPLSVIGVAAALVGVLVILTQGDLAAVFDTSIGVGEWLMLGAIVAWTAYTLAARYGPELPPIGATAAEAGLVVAGMALLAPFLGVTLPPTPAAGWSLLFIVVFPSCASYVLWNRATAVVPPALAGVSLNLIVVFAALATAFQGIPITGAQVTGGLIILVGVVLTCLPPGRWPGSPRRTRAVRSADRVSRGL
jgi:drug/metabolite transporter (DMT)-like permease